MEKPMRWYQIQKERAEEAAIRIDMCLRNQKGQGTVEWLLIIGVITIAVVAAGIKFSNEIQSFIDRVAQRVLEFLK